MEHGKLGWLKPYVVYVFLLFGFNALGTFGQVPGQSADKDQTTTVLKQLIDNDLVGLGILMGKEVAPGTFGLVFWDDEKCGSISARCVDDKIILESLTLLPPASVLKPQLTQELLRARIKNFFGGKNWHDGFPTKSQYRTDVWIQRCSRLDDNLVFEFMYLKDEPTQLVCLKIINYPGVPLQ